MDLYYKGVSFRKLQEHSQVFYPKNAYYSTIYQWIIKYAIMISRVTKPTGFNPTLKTSTLIELNVSRTCNTLVLEHLENSIHKKRILLVSEIFNL